ncbi:MAG TPA: MinD/ParA family protein [Sumerlaeia bacterium]|nr:MinD/ParA family protein [Sumerlaeia bacterium]
MAMDQSSTVRRVAAARTPSVGRAVRPTHVLAVSSGKGGVGKSNFVLNAGIALAQMGRKVLVLDADMGLANIDILVGLTAAHNLSHVLTGEKSIEEVLMEGPSGIHLLPTSSGVEWMANLTAEQKTDFLGKMDALNGRYDILLIDTGAGISSNVIYFNLAARTRIVMVTPEPTSLTDAYALIKVLNRSYRQKGFEIVVNAVDTEAEALGVYRNLTSVADRFLDARLGYLGYVRRDGHLGRAVLRQVPVVELHPDAPVSQSYREAARRIIGLPSGAAGSDMGLFWRRVFDHDTPA